MKHAKKTASTRKDDATANCLKKSRLSTNSRDVSSKCDKKSRQSPATESWVCQLAASAVTSTSQSDRYQSKAERIERRRDKKRRRQERKLKQESDRQRKRAKAIKEENDYCLRMPISFEKKTGRLTKDNLLKELALRVKDSTQLSSHNGTKISNEATADVPVTKRKETGQSIYRKKKWDASGIQPRKRDYGGIGLARPSLLVQFEDPSFFPKLEEEFAEHVPGFFGKQRSAAVKKQTSANMLWRRLLADKKKKTDVKVNGKRLSEMTPDERVDAMIKSGMI